MFNCNSLILSLITIIIAASFHAYINKKYHELFFGLLYGVCSILALYFQKLIFIFISLEIMLLFAGFLIFIGNNRNSVRLSKQYFLTHLFSGSMILTAILYAATFDIHHLDELGLFIHNNELDNIGLFISQNPFLWLILIGLLINIAIFPFSGWMINSYNASSSTSFIYLISFTSKICLTLIAYIFNNYIILSIFGIIMIFHGLYRLLTDKYCLKLFCDLSIISNGFALIQIAAGNSDIIICYYIPTYLLAKALLALVFSVYKYDIINNYKASDDYDKNKISKVILDANKINNFFAFNFTRPYFFSLILSLFIIIASPGSMLFYAKTLMHHNLSNNLLPFFLVIMSATTILTTAFLPWYKIIYNKSLREIFIRHKCKKSYYKIFAIIILSIFIIGLHLFNIKNIFHLLDLRIFISQLLLIIAGISLNLIYFYFISYCEKKTKFVSYFKRFDNKAYNLFDIIGYMVIWLYIEYNKFENIELQKERILAKNRAFSNKSFIVQIRNLFKNIVNYFFDIITNYSSSLIVTLNLISIMILIIYLY